MPYLNETELIKLSDFVGTFQRVVPAFGYPLMSFEKELDDTENPMVKKEASPWRSVKKNISPIKSMVDKSN